MPEGANPRAQAITCIVFATLRHPGQRALVDDDVTADVLRQRWVGASQQRLPVQADGVTTVKVSVPAAGRAGRGNGTNRAGPTRSQQQKAPSISAASQSAGAISHRGPERYPDITTSQITNAIVAAS
jgi:hypothetical protein